jgi:hypothetical protein
MRRDYPVAARPVDLRAAKRRLAVANYSLRRNFSICFFRKYFIAGNVLTRGRVGVLAVGNFLAGSFGSGSLFHSRAVIV